MTTACDAPLADDLLTDYWLGELPPDREAAVEEHLFACAACTARLDALAALSAGVAALARQGRIAGVISRGLLNELQHHGVRARIYLAQPGQTIPCAIFPGDDLVVLSMGADLAGVEAVDVQMTGPNDAPLGNAVDVPVMPGSTAVLWATPGVFVRSMPSIRLHVTLRASGQGTSLGAYVLEHHAQDEG